MLQGRVARYSDGSYPRTAAASCVSLDYYKVVAAEVIGMQSNNPGYRIVAAVNPACDQLNNRENGVFPMSLFAPQ